MPSLVKNDFKLRLKSLEIKGFKSFADKTQVLLDNAVTGIVGPNGCGKSNIVDAIRWVIGEHKIKSLRSDSLDDLVFNGTKNRKAAGMAEVSLTFDNTKNILPTEFSTVTVTRKFFRNGESEYRLNDVTCRLKDIHNLFLDTGVSSDSYAIIELGMVDDIIKDKDASRRRMLEQAAGISIYKTRKKEAKRKLDATQQDLERIEDLLFEIGNNMRTLESQAKKAERYLKIKKEYKQISLELARVTLEDFNERYQKLNKQLTEEEDRRQKAAGLILDDEAQIEAAKNKLTLQEQDLADKQRRFNELQNQIRNLESEKKLSTQQLRHLQEREGQLKAYLKGAKQQLELLNKQDLQSSEKLQEAQEQLQGLQSTWEAIRLEVDQKRVDFDQTKKELEKKRTHYQALQNQQFAIEKQTAVADNKVNNIQNECQRLEEEAQNKEEQMTQLKAEQDQLTQSLQKKEEQIAQAQSQKETLQKQIGEIETNLEQLREEETAHHRLLDAKQNEHDLLKSLVDSSEGYPESIKFLKKSKDWNQKTPLLSDIFEVPRTYRVALEVALDTYLNYYVAPNREEALQAVRLLKQHKKGKASFFLLDSLKAPRQQKREKPKGFICALEVVKTERAYQALAEHLLGHVLIEASTHEDHSFIDRELPDGFIYISKDGHLQKRNHSLLGGSIGAFEGNKIGRAKNLDLLAKEIESISQKVSTLKKERIKNQENLQSLKSELKKIPLDTYKNELNRLQNQLSNAGVRMEQNEEQKKRNLERIGLLQQQLKDISSDFAGQQDQLISLTKELKQHHSAIQTATEAFALVEKAYNKAGSDYNQHQLLLTQQKSRLGSLQQEIQFRKGQIEDLEKQIKSNQQQLENTSEQISTTTGKLNFGDDEMQELLEKKEQDNRNLSELESLYHTARKALNDHEQRISRQRKAKEQAETLVNELRERSTEMKLRVAGIKERLQVEFHADLEEVLAEERTTDLSLEALQEESEHLKQKIERIGEVNPTAVEAYQEIKLRYDFIEGQKADLENARDTLFTTIDEIEKTANERFEITFNKVRDNFIEVFKALFTEDDHADLRLTDPDNIAETGIEIYAQPKGKRPSTLTQLSGGEKTLTSTAFLFAIYLIKPAPFCILDEVDAPLDDANVDKFTNMIRQFSDHSQFIIITHNKQTMASVDVIYGVTMQEMGVSKLVPVDFRSLEH